MTIHFVPHPQLVIAHDASNQTTVVLCPPDRDTAAILDLASVVLPEPRYRELVDALQRRPPGHA